MMIACAGMVYQSASATVMLCNKLPLKSMANSKFLFSRSSFYVYRLTVLWLV